MVRKQVRARYAAGSLRQARYRSSPQQSCDETQFMSAYHKSALPAGFLLAEYTIESVLGHGGFGITYLAHDTSLSAQVAIKEYLPHSIAGREGDTALITPKSSRGAIRDYQWGLKNFIKEARALAKFKHPHIVRVLRFIEANGTAYMVMEYEQGRTLADLLKSDGPRLEESSLLRIIIPILNGLHAVHEIGMLHLDIKPENIYLSTEGRPFLIDFGSARQSISRTGQVRQVALTPGYAPMEQYPDKGKQGPWTDIHALGATLYRCVIGKKPIDALDRYRAVLDYDTDPLRSAVSKAGRNRYQNNLLECIDWALKIYPKDRPQSARELQDGLMGKRRIERGGNVGVGASNGPANHSNEVTSSFVRKPRRSTKGKFAHWIWVGLVVAGVIAAAYVFWPKIRALLPDASFLLRSENSDAVSIRVFRTAGGKMPKRFRAKRNGLTDSFEFVNQIGESTRR